MSKKCNSCGTTDKAPASVPYVVHESAMARAERHIKALIWVIVLLIVLLVGTNVDWMIYDNSFEDVNTIEEYQIEQDAESGNNNSIINGGEIVNGEAND